MFAATRWRTRDGLAFASEGERLTWRGYDRWSDQLAGHLADEAFAPATASQFRWPTGPACTAAFVACEKAGLVIVGIGGRAGAREVDHLMARTGARDLITEVSDVVTGEAPPATAGGSRRTTCSS